MACRPILQRGRLQRASGFSITVIFAAVHIECTRVILYLRELADRLPRVDWLPEGKGRYRAAFCRLSGPSSRGSANKVGMTHLAERNHSCIC